MDGQGAVDAAARLRAGIERQQAGDLASAAQHYRAVLAAQPENTDALHLLGVASYLSNDPATAAGLLRKAHDLAPGNAEICCNMGAALFAAGDVGGAAEAFRAAAELDPGKIDAHANLAAAQAQLGAADAAIESFARAHALDPARAHFIKRLGELCLARERFEEAAGWLLQSLEIDPSDIDSHSNLAFVLDRLERFEEAEAHYSTAHAARPDLPEIANNFGMLLARTGRTDKAEALFARAFAAPPEAWADPANLAGALCNQGRFEEALPVFEALVAARPGDASLLADQARALSAAQRYGAAAEALRNALAADAGRHDLHIALAHTLLRDGKADEAIAALSAVPQSAPDYLRARLDLCMLLAGEKRHDEAARVARAIPDIPGYQPGLFLRPYVVLRECCDFDGLERIEVSPEAIDDGNLASSAANFLELLPWAEDETQIEALAALHRRWGEAAEAEAAATALPPLPATKGEGPLRIGFVSSDLRRHSVARFVLPLVEHYDRDRLEIFCYAPRVEQDDELQLRIRERVAAFRVAGGLSDRALAEAVRSDAVDILFELNGFTAESRLKSFAWRAAPVQISWLGYPFTTGLPSADYMVVDAHMASREPAWLAETQLLVAGGFVSYDPLEDVAPAPAPPLARNGYVTFGSLTSPYKITRRSVTLWAGTMQRLPESRFAFIHPAFGSGPAAENLAGAFAALGIDRARLGFEDNRATGRSHFACYADIDIVLDTAPLTGGTTTCDALWMGVPVVTMCGPALHQRLSHGLLCNIGLAELSAGDDAGFVDIAAALANDTDRLSALRQDLRGRVRAHTLGDGAAYAREFQATLEQLAQRHALR